MQMLALDWAIVAVFFAFLTWLALYTRKYVRGVADFLACNRCADRYLLCISSGIAGMGVMGLMANFEQNYSAGLPPTFWGFMISPLYFVVGLSGFVIYRYRQTRVLTIGQFLEIRYSRVFRIFTGILGYAAGLLCFGITPGLGTRFIITYCGLPPSLNLLGASVPTLPVAMFVLMAVALFFTYVGGQVSVIITDFTQGMFSNIIFLVILIVFLVAFDWGSVVQGLKMAPADASMINPFRTSGVKDFNIFYFLIAGFGFFYNVIGVSGGGYNGAARTPHEARMGSVLVVWRAMALNAVLVVLPITAYAIMHGTAFAALAARVHQSLAGVADPQAANQLIVPVVISLVLPAGLVGAFCAVILAAFVAMTNFSLHVYGSVFIQDILLPFRRRPFEPEHHMRILRLSILGVAVFVYFWSLLVPVKGFIFMFMALMGALAGGGGAVIIGGLYWNRGTTTAAWGAMLTGAMLAAGGWLLQQTNPSFPLNGQIMSFICWIASIIVYLGISLLETVLFKRPGFDMDRMLHRGAYAAAQDAEEKENGTRALSRWRQLIDMGHEFSFADKAVYLGTILWAFGYLVCFLAGSFLGLTRDTTDEGWARFWYIFIMVYTVTGVATTVWFLIGGGRDIINMLRRLNAATIDTSDDGSVGVQPGGAQPSAPQSAQTQQDFPLPAGQAADHA